MKKKKVIVIGAGPAGLTAAIYALRANKKVLIFEAKTYGGQIVNTNKITREQAIKDTEYSHRLNGECLLYMGIL